MAKGDSPIRDDLLYKRKEAKDNGQTLRYVRKGGLIPLRDLCLSVTRDFIYKNK